MHVSASADQLVIEVLDNGVGLGHTHRRSDLDDLRRRAERHTGQFHIGPYEPSGTRLSRLIPMR